MNDDPDRGPVDAGTVKYLRLLVTILSVTMVVGFIIIVVLFVIRFSDAFGPSRPSRPADMALPDSISLPAGARATAFTRGGDWFAVVTDDDRILIFDAASGALRKEISVR